MNLQIPIQLKKEVDLSYKVNIGTLPELTYERKVAIVTNPKVAGLHLQTLLSKLKTSETYIIVVPDGEEHKGLATVEMILNRMFEHKLNRKSLLIALGGGVIGDMTGFTASIYQRGIEFVQIPTTLLSQVDASVGGKTGVNNHFGKNLIGAFCQPKAVYIDTTFLKTLPDREFSAGIAEIVKMAVMFDKDFFEFLEKEDLFNEKILHTAIKRAVELKAEVVSQDEKEKGIRAVLNYGHTFCHVVEQETAYKRYLHGEAVSIGMMMANALALKLGDLNQEESNRIEALLIRYKLPIHYNIQSVDEFYEHFFLDKKSTDSKIMFILPKHLGGYQQRDDIAASDVKIILENFK